MRTGSAPRAAPAVRHACNRTVLARDACMRPGHAKSRAAARRRPSGSISRDLLDFSAGGDDRPHLLTTPTTMTDGAVDKLADDVQELHLGTSLLALTQTYRRFLR